jgi:hypothetical protein
MVKRDPSVGGYQRPGALFTFSGADVCECVNVNVYINSDMRLCR